MKNNILITGGAGYIGAHVCKALALVGYVPVAYDNLSTGHRDFVQWGPFVHGDILDTLHLVQCMKEYDISAVIHMAALAYVSDSMMSPDAYYTTNAAGALSILKAMKEQQINHIVVSSTCSVYGQPEQMPIQENFSLAPINPYGFTKVIMERMLDDFEYAFAISHAVLRYFNAAGADESGLIGDFHDPEPHLIPRILLAAHNKIPELQIFGDDYPTPDGTCIRDFVHVTDLAHAHVQALCRLQEGSVSFKVNLGTGSGFSVRQILSATEKILGRPIPFSIESRRGGDPAILVASSEAAKKTLDWIPEFSDLHSILQSALHFYLKHTCS